MACTSKRVNLTRVCSYLLIGCMIIISYPFDLKAQTFQTSAPQALLMDAQTHTVLFEKAADEFVIPASMTKIMTAAVVFEEIARGRLKLDDEMSVSENAWRKGGAVAGGTSMFAVIGNRIKVRDLLTGLLVSSGNDAALTLAEGIAGNELNFAKLMMERAKEIGLVKSVFRNATGLAHTEQKTTLRELAKLASHVIDTYPELYRLYSAREFIWNKVRQQNRNPLLAMEIGADGLQTGNLDENFGLVGSALINGQRLIVVVHGLKSAKDRASEARKLLEWGGRSFETSQLFKADEVIANARVYGGDKTHVPLVAKGAVMMLSVRGAPEKRVAKVVYTSPILPPLKAGLPIGRLLVMRGDVQALDLPLYAKDDVGVGGLTRRSLDAAGELTQQWARRIFRKVVEYRTTTPAPIIPAASPAASPSSVQPANAATTGSKT